MRKYLENIECSDQPLDISFHPKQDNLIACALVDGTMEVHDVRWADNEKDEDDEHDSILSSMAVHRQLVPVKENNMVTTKPASCRAVIFSTDGERIYTGGLAGDLAAIDGNRATAFSSTSDNNLLWRIKSATESKGSPLVSMLPFLSAPLIATGDDLGGVRLWDERLCGNSSKANGSTKRPQGCVLSWKANEDYISGLEVSHEENTLLASSADGRLSVFDLRMARDPVSSQTSFRLSDDQGDELLSLKIMKNGRKVVCGSQEGVLSIFSWGTWGDCSDRFPGHPASIDALLKVDEDTLLTGSSDGLIRVVQIHPDKFVGVLGNHGDFPIEKLEWNSNKEIVGSMSHDNYVRLWDAKVLYEECKNVGEDQKIGQNSSSAATKKESIAVKDDSEDDWEDESNSGSDKEEDSDEDDSDEEEEAPTANDQRKKRLKTDNERFFDDL
jgi:WD40 repeat protein